MELYFYVGLDVHQKTSTYCVRDRHGKELRTVTVKGGWARLIEHLRRLAEDGPIAVCYEASLGYGTRYDQLASFCAKVVVAHPGRLRLIFRSKRKNDRIDAQKLASLLVMDQVPQVHVPALDVRAWRELIEFRRALIDRRTRCKNGLRALLRSYGVVVASGRSLWTKKGRTVLEQLQWPTPQAALRRTILLSELDHLDTQVNVSPSCSIR